MFTKNKIINNKVVHNDSPLRFEQEIFNAL